MVVRVELEEGVWIRGDRIAGGGFGEVFRATAPDGSPGALKFVPKEPEADRELLIGADLQEMPNVLPILDVGDFGDAWVLAMPLAMMSLRTFLDERDTPLTFDEARPILLDIASALQAMDGRVVHRDLKPQNVLLVNNTWQVADFGIARYADATTASYTWKDAKSNAYAAPEQWRLEKTTSRTDVYAFGVIAYEILSGTLPFVGLSAEDLRRQHLECVPDALRGISDSVASLVAGCLMKQQESRPTAVRILRTLERAAAPVSKVDARLQSLNKQAQARAATEAADAEVERARQERRERLLTEAEQGWKTIVQRFRADLEDHIPMAVVKESNDGLVVSLDGAVLKIHRIGDARNTDWREHAPAFDVIAHAAIEVQSEEPLSDPRYVGCSYSLWYCDAQVRDEFLWFETAFRENRSVVISNPYSRPDALRASGAAGAALAGARSSRWRLDRPFEPVDPAAFDEFVDRWLELFADAVQRTLREPGRARIDPYNSFRSE